MKTRDAIANRAAVRRWRQENPDKVKLQKQRENARLRERTRNKICSRLCYECGGPLGRLSASTQKTCSKECRKIRRTRMGLRWMEDNRGHAASVRKARYDKNPQRYKDYQKQYHVDNKDQDNAAHREYRNNNLESERERSRTYQRANPGVMMFHAKRKAAQVQKAKVVIKELAKTNPGIYIAIAGTKDKGKAAFNALKSLGIQL